MRTEYGDFCDAHHPTRGLGVPDFDDLTPEILLELVSGYSTDGAPRAYSDDALRQYWHRHRLAIHDLVAGRVHTLGGNRVERVWLTMLHRYGDVPTPAPLWASNAFDTTARR